MLKCIAKTAEFLEGFVLFLFWSHSSFEEKAYFEIVQWPWKKSLFNSLEIDQMLHFMQPTVLTFQVIERPPTPLLEILKVTLLIHKEFMFWAKGCTDN